MENVLNHLPKLNLTLKIFLSPDLTKNSIFGLKNKISIFRENKSRYCSKEAVYEISCKLDNGKCVESRTKVDAYALNFSKSRFYKNEVFGLKNQNFEILRKSTPDIIVRKLYVKFH